MVWEPDTTGHIHCAAASLALHAGVVMPGESAQRGVRLFLEPRATHGEEAMT